MRKDVSCYSVKFVFSVSWQFRRGLTLFLINLMWFFSYLQQKQKNRERLLPMSLSAQSLNYITYIADNSELHLK